MGDVLSCWGLVYPVLKTVAHSAHSEQLASVRHRLIGHHQDHRAISVGKAEHEHFRHELADLLRRKIHHGRDLPPHELVQPIMHGTLSRGSLYADLGSEIDLQLLAR